MAEVPINRFIPSGYDEDFVVQPDEDLHCIICQLPSKGPVLTRCGHRFCRECLEEYLRRQEQDGCILACPTDRQALERNKTPRTRECGINLVSSAASNKRHVEFDLQTVRSQDIFPDKLTERKILSLLIKCTSEGCEWNGELRAKEDHLASCIFKAVSCTNKNCEVKVPRKDLTEHVNTSCQWMIVNCVYCKEHHPKCQMENHLETCEGLLIPCPNKCGTICASDTIPNHVENSCPLTTVPCPYIWIGCNTETKREELESHLQCETGHHLELACCKLNSIQDEVREKTEKLNSLEEKVTSTQRQHQEKVSNLKNQLEERVKLYENQLKERVMVLENQFEERVNIQTGEINEKLNQNNNKVRKELNTDRWTLFFCFAVVFVVGGVLIGMSNRAIQRNFETKMEKMEKCFKDQMNSLQSKLEMKVDEEEVKAVQSQLEKIVGEVQKNLQNQLDKKVHVGQKKTEKAANLKSLESQRQEKVSNPQNQDEERIVLHEDKHKEKIKVLLDDKHEEKGNIETKVKEKAANLKSLEEKESKKRLEERVKLTSIESQRQEKVSNPQIQDEERIVLHEDKHKEKIKVLLDDKHEEKGNIETKVNEKVKENHKKVEKELNTGREALFFSCVLVFVIVIIFLCIAKTARRETDLGRTRRAPYRTQHERPPVKCWACGQAGHFARACPVRTAKDC